MNQNQNSFAVLHASCQPGIKARDSNVDKKEENIESNQKDISELLQNNNI